MKYGQMHISTKEVVESIIIKQEYGDHEERQFGFGSRGLLRGIIDALLIRDLIGRRRRPFFSTPYGGGFGSPYIPYGVEYTKLSLFYKGKNPRRIEVIESPGK